MAAASSALHVWQYEWFISICLKSGNTKTLVAKWPCCFKDILPIKCPASLRWALSWENTDICHIYTIYIYIYVCVCVCVGGGGGGGGGGCNRPVAQLCLHNSSETIVNGDLLETYIIAAFRIVIAIKLTYVIDLYETNPFVQFARMATVSKYIRHSINHVNKQRDVGLTNNSETYRFQGTCHYTQYIAYMMFNYRKVCDDYQLTFHPV